MEAKSASLQQIPGGGAGGSREAGGGGNPGEFLAQNLLRRPTLQMPRLLCIFVWFPPAGKQVLSYFAEGCVICTIW